MNSFILSVVDDGVVQVILCYGGRNYLLCSLKKGLTLQVPLDLNFQTGAKIALTCNGQGHVHLTGYLIPDDDEDPDLDESEEEEAETEEEEEEEKKLDILEEHSKRKAIESPKNIKNTKRVKQEVVESSDEVDDSEDSENEEDFLLQKEQKVDDSDEDENDDKNHYEHQEQEGKKKSTKLQQREKKMKQNQEQNQQKRTLDKQKLINGKDVKQVQQGKQQKKNKEELQQNVQSEMKKKEGGLQVEDLAIGNGTLAKYGKLVYIYYVGSKNGKIFHTHTEGDCFKLRLGKGKNIKKGWDVGIIGMKVGGTRRITLPSNMAYVYYLYNDRYYLHIYFSAFCLFFLS